MLPFNKAQWYLGYSSLAILTEQDRRHWLLKSDKQKEIVDTTTGSMFFGQIDNQGSYINVSTQKLGYVHPVLKQYLPSDFRNVFELSPSALPFSYDVNGLCCARIISTEYVYSGENKNYKIQFNNCEEVIIPFSNMNDSNVYGFSFIKTSTAPKLLMIDGNGDYTIEVDFQLFVHGAVYYYPLDTFQPIEIDDKGSGTYETVLIDSNGFIGYPAFWFTCDETNVGPQFAIDDLYRRFDFCGNDVKNLYNVNVFLMDKVDTENDHIRVYPAEGYTFTNSDVDFTIPIDINRIKYTIVPSGQSEQVYDIPVSSVGNNELYMVKSTSWSYSQFGYYECLIRDFNSNYSFPDVALKPIFNLALDINIPFEKSTNDIGFAGVDITANTQANEYPFNLNSWSGLPEWINDERDSSQRVIVYAIHNTPNSSEQSPESRQTAALILDPGIPYDDSEPTEYDDSHIGRVYVLSNDEPEYVNNAIATHPKPDRTLARICDIPVSVAQLSNISGIAPTSIVDPKYVRSEASYTEKEKKRLWNVLGSRWVRPINITVHGQRAIDEFPTTETNPQVFNSLDTLKLINLNNELNGFREYTNLNAMVDGDEVSLYSITNGGSGYATQDVGNIIIGGFAFNYVVQSVTDGVVETLTVGPSSDHWSINLANFDMMDGTTGITKQYGTSPVSGVGTGLKVQLKIDNYASKIPTLGDIFPDLFALVRTPDGLWMYQYDVTESSWNKTVCITEYEKTSEGEVSTKDSYINSILPNVNAIPIGPWESDQPETSINVISTASYINVVDKTKIPVYDNANTTKTSVDINRFYCNHIYTAFASEKNFTSMLQKIKEQHHDRFDSYIIWKWKDESDSNNKEFEYGIIHRSLNNLQSLDAGTTTLPPNELICKNYVNTNASTTVTWDLEDYCMTLVWTFNPESRVHEKYIIDANTRDLTISRTKMTWDNVDVYTNNFQTKINLTDANGKMLWNIASNVLRYPDSLELRNPLYSQPDYVNYIDKGENISNIPEKYQPGGNWQLVFPRVQTLHFRNSSGYEYTPTKMNVIKNVNTQARTDVLNINDKPVNYKTMIVNTNDDGTASIKVYNVLTGTWNDI